MNDFASYVNIGYKHYEFTTPWFIYNTNLILHEKALHTGWHVEAYTNVQLNTNWSNWMPKLKLELYRM